MEGQRLPPCAAHELDDAAERDRFERTGGVRVTTGPLGTEIKWSAFSPCFGSLFHAAAWIDSVPGPFILRYYLSGWFEDILETANAARERIEQIISKSELRIVKRAFVQSTENVGRSVPKLIQQAIDQPDRIHDVSIKCFYDEHAKKFKVSHIGVQSTIARFYGMEPVIYPYVNGGSYDEIVCEGYTVALNSGRARYDQVLAAMRMPNNIIYWVPYHRYIIPNAKERNRDSVTVVTEIAPIGFSIV